MDTNTATSGTPMTGKAFTATATVLFIIITLCWFLVHPFDPVNFTWQKNIWSSTYVLLSLVGGISGLVASKRWGGGQTVLGRAVLAFSVGLFLQSFGQLCYNYFTLAYHIQAPYPSVGDIGYFGSVIAYIYGGLVLFKGMKFPMSGIHNKLVAVILPFAMLSFSYFVFLNSYQPTGSVLTTFLDFGYPLGQAVYVSVAVLLVFMSQKYLGGVMKQPIMLLFAALIVQYVCDFDFLYQANHGTWYAGGWGDYLYVVSYFLMAMVLINMGEARAKLG